MLLDLLKYINAILGIGYNELRKTAKYIGIGQTDIIAHIVFLSVNVVYYFTVMIFIKRNIQLLDNIGNTSSGLARKYGLKEGLITKKINEGISKRKLKRLKFLIAIEWTGIVFYHLFWYLVMSNAWESYGMKSFKNDIILIITALLGTLMSGLTLMPITAITVEQGISCSVSFITESFERWYNNFDHLKNNKSQDESKMKISAELESLILYGNDLLDFTTLYTKGMGLILLFKVIIILTSVTICGFGVTTIFFRLSSLSTEIIISCLSFALQVSYLKNSSRLMI